MLHKLSRQIDEISALVDDIIMAYENDMIDISEAIRDNNICSVCAPPPDGGCTACHNHDKFRFNSGVTHNG